MKIKNKNNKHSNDSHSSAKLKKIMLVLLLKYTPVMQSILCLTFSMNVRTTQCLNYGGQESKKTIYSL